MAISFPYPLEFLADKLPISSVVFDIQRNDELSGSGDGRVFQAELAPPLWMATVNLQTKLNAEIKQISAKIRKLNGSQDAMFLYDPLSLYPQSDPDGSLLGSSSTKINAIGGDLGSFSLNGLPAGYKLTAGDKISAAYGSKFDFYEVSEDVVANSSGVTPIFGVFPYVSAGLAAGNSVSLRKPAMKCIIMPGSHNPGTSDVITTQGSSFKVIQKK